MPFGLSSASLCQRPGCTCTPPLNIARHHFSLSCSRQQEQHNLFVLDEQQASCILSLVHAFSEERAAINHANEVSAIAHNGPAKTIEA